MEVRQNHSLEVVGSSPTPAIFLFLEVYIMDSACDNCLCNSCALDSDDCPRNLPCLSTGCQEVYDCDCYEAED